MNVVASETIYQIINLVFGPPGDMSAQTLMKQSERHDFCNFRGGGLFNHFLESEKVTYAIWSCYGNNGERTSNLVKYLIGE